MTLWYLSYANEDGFDGAVVTESETAEGAILRARALGLERGTQVAFFDVPPEEELRYPECERDRLLSVADLQRLDPTSQRLEDWCDQHGIDVDALPLPFLDLDA